MAPVALDADVVIAFLDASDDQHEQAVELLRSRLAVGDAVLIAASVYAEVLVRPLQQGADGAIDDFIAGIGASVVAVDRVIARRAAELRGAHRAVRLPDALSLATALVRGADFLTLDHSLARLAEKEHRGS